MLRASNTLNRLRRGGRKWSRPMMSHESNEIVGSMRTGYFNAGTNKGSHMDTVAQRLGFEKATDLYPEETYPLESGPPKMFYITLKDGYFPMEEVAGTKLNALRELGLSHGDAWSVVMNTSQNNDILWSLKRHVEVKPLLFPDGEPDQNTNPARLIVDDSGNCRILSEDHPLVLDAQRIEFDGYRRETGVIDDEAEDLGISPKLYWQSLNSPLKRVRDQLSIYKFSEEEEKLQSEVDKLKFGEQRLNKIEDIDVELLKFISSEK